MLSCAQNLITNMGMSPTAPVAQVYASQVASKNADLSGVTALDQCMTEQRYVRDSITRSLIYNQVLSCLAPAPAGPLLCCVRCGGNQSKVERPCNMGVLLGAACFALSAPCGTHGTWSCLLWVGTSDFSHRFPLHNPCHLA